MAVRLLVTLEDRWRRARQDVVVEAPRGTSVGELLEALDKGAPDGRGGTGWLLGERLLSPDAALGEVVHDGDVLASGPGGPLLGEPTSAEGSLVELRIVGGPDAGRRIPLRPGRYVIGRGEEADIALGADPQISRRHAVLDVGEPAVVIEDAGAANGILAGGERVERWTLRPGEPVQCGETVLALAAVPARDAVVANDGEGRRSFNRPPRIPTVRAAPRVAVPTPPVARARTHLPAAVILVPLVLAGALAGALGNLEWLLVALLSPLVGALAALQGRRDAADAARAQAQYEAAVAEATQRVAVAVAEESAAARAETPDPATLAAIAEAPLARLWERRRGDEDVAVLRLGLADRPAALELVGGATRGVAGDELAQRARLREVPVTVRLAETGVLGLAGPRARTQALARALVVQAAVLHAPDDCLLAICTDEDQDEAWGWARWLPHARAEGERVARIGNTPATLAALASELAGIVEDRLRDAEGGGRAEPGPLVLVVLDGAYRLAALPPLTRVLRRGPEVGVLTIALDEAERLLPEECSATAVFAPEEPTRCDVRVRNEAPRTGVLADLVTPAWAEQVARALAPMRLARASEDVSVLPTAVRLLELVGLDPPTPDGVLGSWRAGGRSTAAVVGVSASGPVRVDLRRDGPHGLVAGTTGSGKSEFLQSLITSLALENRPDALQFVLVDYKGGAAFKECAELPHTVGLVTDLDSHLTERALASLGAELRRRERLFRAAGARDIDEYWSSGAAPGTPLARLLIVIDEFAALAEELPAFVDGIVDLARRGRSLGIHLVLATQRPSGVVSPAIRTNTNLRLAMRVTDVGDSVDVIDSPLAARIAKETPGRAFLRVGHEQLSEIQAAQIGGRPPGALGGGVHVAPVGWLGLGAPLAGPADAARDTGASDLAALVRAVAAAAAATGAARSLGPWLPPLPELVLLEDVLAGGARPDLAPYGLEDRPLEQSRGVAGFDLTGSGHLLFVGDAGSGRTSALRTLAAACALRFSPADLHLYAVDAGSGALGVLEELPHCGAVVARAAPERVERLLTKVQAELERRQQLLADGGFANIAEQRAARPVGERLPYLVVLVDRFEAFSATFDLLDNGRLVALLLQVMREASGTGIRFVLTGDRSALSGRLGALVEHVVLLRLNDRSAYTLAGLNPRTLPERFAPGRGFALQGGTELQVALLDPDPSGGAQADALRRIARSAHARAGDVAPELLPAPIGVLPRRVRLSALGAAPGPTAGGLVGLLGIGGDRLAPQRVELAELGGLLIGGPARSGRSNALVVLARSLLGGGGRLVLVTPRRSPLAALAGAPGVVAALDGAGAHGAALAALLEREAARGGLAVLVDDAELLAEPATLEPLTAFARRARDSRSALVAAGATSELGVALRGFVPELRKLRSGLLLCPHTPADGELFGIRLPRTLCFVDPPGRAVRVGRGAPQLLQVPLDDAAP